MWDTAQKATGLKSNTEPSAPGSHAHSFTGATFTVTPGVGESLVAYILASNCDPPREIIPSLAWPSVDPVAEVPQNLGSTAFAY